MFSSREQDIRLRGGNYYVHDFSGQIVKLEDAEIWYDTDGNYVSPEDWEPTIIGTYKMIFNWINT